MEDTRNELRFYGMKPHKALKRQIDRQLQKWLLRHKTSPHPTRDATYRVFFEREGGTCLCCHLQIQVGKELWESYDFGKSVQDALSRALQHVGKSFSQSIVNNLAQPQIAKAVA